MGDLGSLPRLGRSPGGGSFLEHRAELPASRSVFPLAVDCIQGSAYVSILISQFAPPAPSLLRSHVQSQHPHLYSCPGIVFICTIFRFHIYALIYDICFSLSYSPYAFITVIQFPVPLANLENHCFLLSTSYLPLL